MGLEQRSGRFYFYEKRREGRRVVSSYIGGGVVALVAAEMNAQDRQEREWQRQKQRKTHHEQKEIDRQLARAERTLGDILRDVLCSAGFHQHKGQWRKRRGDRR
jgi:hypothetical protein